MYPHLVLGVLRTGAGIIEGAVWVRGTASMGVASRNGTQVNVRKDVAERTVHIPTAQDATVCAAGVVRGSSARTSRVQSIIIGSPSTPSDVTGTRMPALAKDIIANKPPYHDIIGHRTGTKRVDLVVVQLPVSFVIWPQRRIAKITRAGSHVW